MSIGSTNVDFKEIYDAMNGVGAHAEANNPAIGMDSFYGMSFTNGITPVSGAIGIGGNPEGTNNMRGKIIKSVVVDGNGGGTTAFSFQSKAEGSSYNTSNTISNIYKWKELLSNTDTFTNLIELNIYKSTNGLEGDDGHHTSYSIIKIKNNYPIRLHFKQSSELNYDFVSVYVGDNEGNSTLQGMLDGDNTPNYTPNIEYHGEFFGVDSYDMPSHDTSWYYLDIDANKYIIIVFSKDTSADVGKDAGYFYYKYN